MSIRVYYVGFNAFLSPYYLMLLLGVVDTRLSLQQSSNTSDFQSESGKVKWFYLNRIARNRFLRYLSHILGIAQSCIGFLLFFSYIDVIEFQDLLIGASPNVSLICRFLYKLTSVSYRRN